MRAWGQLLIVICALLAIVGAGAGADNSMIGLHYVFKPLATGLIFLLAWRVQNPVDQRYRHAVLAGIALSLCGDVFLMLPHSLLANGFLLGLSSFLLAHLCFLRAFSSDTRLFSRPLLLLGFLLLGSLNLAVLGPGLAAALKVPVMIYVGCLTAMTAQAVTRHLQWRNHSSRLAAIGSVLFLLSDTVLAYNKFYALIPVSALWILSTYYAALVLIARSVTAKAPST